MSNTVLKGSCLCGIIKYEIRAPLSDVINCHCTMCQKAHGAAFRTRASVSKEDFEFLSGEEKLRYYESSAGEKRSFCRICGSPIITRFDDMPGVFGFALGTLDTDPGVSIQRHVFTRFKAPWFEIGDDLPQVEELSDEELGKAKQ